MSRMEWIDHEFIVKYESMAVELLPKEYELLKYLWERPFQVFSRDGLLDAVWSMEHPTDRTVDDHIYRLRKKLKPLSSVMSIGTVRGKGYLLKVEEDVYDSPLIQDQEVASSAQVLFHKYHLYGQGKALKVLEENQDIFGIDFDYDHLCYLRFMKGDFHWFLEETNVPFWQSCYYLIHIYSHIQPDKEKTLDYFTKALNVEELPTFHHEEIRLLNQWSLLIFTNRLEEAEAGLSESKREIEARGLKTLYPFTLLTELYLVFLQGPKGAIDEKMQEVKAALEKFPYSREQATFEIMQGVQCLLKKEDQGADSHFKQGFKLFKDAHYMPGLLISLNVILFFIQNVRPESELATVYGRMWKEYSEKYRFSELRKSIEAKLDFHLKRKKNSL